MKKKQKGLLLEKFNVARLTKKMQYIYGGGITQPTDGCSETDIRDPGPLTNSSLECDSSLFTCQDGAVSENPGH